MSKLFIAPKLKIGFQNRSGTYTGKLAYIIYFDEKGKLRKEKSWESWRDTDIAPEEYENVPTDGFTINKDIKRYSGEWFSSTRTMIRIHDPRGFEFEITTENLIGILMHTDCLRRGLVGEFVYAWMGPELVLLPTNSEEYQNAVKYTTGLSKKVSSKSLIPGVSYKTKQLTDAIYIGKMNWYEYPYPAGTIPRKEIKTHVFTCDNGKTFERKSSPSFLSEPNSDVPVDNYAELVDKFNKIPQSKKNIRFEARRVPLDTTLVGADSYYSKLKTTQYWVESTNPNHYIVGYLQAQIYTPFEAGRRDYTKSTIEYVDLCEQGCYDTYGIETGTDKVVLIAGKRDRATYHRWDTERTRYSLENIPNLKLYKMYMVFDDGTEKEINNLNDLNNQY